jgi:hypothetical protein
VGKRLPNPRLAKIHLSYKVEEIARLFGKHKNTVYKWIKEGLRPCTDQRQYLYQGSDIRAFLEAKYKKNKRSMAVTEVYCVRCREPKTPAGNMADYKPDLPTSGQLEAMCPTCSSMIYRRVNLEQLEQIRRYIVIALPPAESRLSKRLDPCVNSDFDSGASTHAKLQL